MMDISEIKNMKEAVMAAIMDLAYEHEDVVMLESDMMSCLGSEVFFRTYPDRAFNCGIAEANMIGVAAGLSSMGYVPFADSFGVFSSRRDYDQFFLSVNYAGQRVHLIGTDPGISAQINGGTHMPFEDIALMRQIPGLVVFEPSDIFSCYSLIKQAYDSCGSSYLRVGRNGSSLRYDSQTDIELGKGIVLREGDDLAIIATGEIMVAEAEKAVEMLNAKNYSVFIVDLHTIKPLDTALIEKIARKTGRILVCENGRYAGGVGEAVAGFLAKTYPVRMDYVNVGERFGEVGDLQYLKDSFCFNASDIARKAEALINMH